MNLVLLALTLLFPFPALSAESQAGWQAVMEHAVANQPGRVGGRAFASAFGVKAWSKEGREFARAAKQVKEWPVISVEGEALVFTERGAGEGVKLELVNAEGGEFLIDGKPFKVDTDRPLMKRLKEALAAPETTRAPFFELIPSAHAAVAGAESIAPALFPVVSAVARKETFRKLASDPELRRKVEKRAKPAREKSSSDQATGTEGLSNSAQ